jgi:2,5-dihydroxypyridine 5,6-dioxygenase
MNWTPTLTPLFHERLSHCGVRSKDLIAIFSDATTREHYVTAFAAAAEMLGAAVYQITIPPTWSESRADVVIGMLKDSNLVVDLASAKVLFLYSAAFTQALDAGLHILRCGEPENILIRQNVNTEIVNRGREAANLLDKAHRIRVTSVAGTDLTMEKSNRKVILQDGLVDVRGNTGDWDNWGGTFVYTTPVETSVDGVLVIDRGDAILTAYNRYVEEPIKCRVSKGRIHSIEGGADAILLNNFLESWGDDSVYLTAHIGWGCEPRADWNTMARYAYTSGHNDLRSYEGNVLIAFGANYGIGGTTRVSPLAHVDVPLLNCNFTLDDTPVVQNGRCVHPQLALKSSKSNGPRPSR